MTAILSILYGFLMGALGYFIGISRRQGYDYDCGYQRGHFDALYEIQKQQEEEENNKRNPIGFLRNLEDAFGPEEESEDDDEDEESEDP